MINLEPFQKSYITTMIREGKGEAEIYRVTGRKVAVYASYHTDGTLLQGSEYFIFID